MVDGEEKIEEIENMAVPLNSEEDDVFGDQIVPEVSIYHKALPNLICH